jgi:hypothetical protein
MQRKREFPPNKNKKNQIDPRKIACISLDSFGRIGAFQKVTANPNKKTRHRRVRLRQVVSNALTIWTTRAHQRERYSTVFRFSQDLVGLIGVGCSSALRLPLPVVMARLVLGLTLPSIVEEVSILTLGLKVVSGDGVGDDEDFPHDSGEGDLPGRLLWWARSGCRLPTLGPDKDGPTCRHRSHQCSESVRPRTRNRSA